MTEHYHASNLPPRVQLTCLDETRTVQSEAESCEINNIMRKYERTGLIDHVKENGRYEDLPGEVDFHEAMNLVSEAQQSFDDLPATIRKEFHNSPGEFLSFVENPENVERMAELGLTNPSTTPLGEPLQPSTAAPEGNASNLETDTTE